MRRFFMALASYTMWYLIGLACWRAGLVKASNSTVVISGVGILASQFLFFAIIRSGINCRFRDPSLTVPQIFVGLAWALLLIALSREIRGVMLTVYMIILLFGIFGLDRRQFLFTGSFAYAGFAGLVLYEQLSGMELFTDGYYLVSLIVLGGVLSWTTMFGTYVSNLRHKLQARNEELEKVLLQMRDLADHDDLTGLLNRRVITNVLKKLKARADRTGEPFSICILDLDKFKDVNDAFGHLTGDRVLVEFAETMSKELRGMDLIAHGTPSFGRYGGEEFILLLPRTGLKGAEQCAERLRERQDRRQQHSVTPPCTLSAGVAAYRPGEDIESLLRRADRALYAAKHGGRNRVALAET